MNILKKIIYGALIGTVCSGLMIYFDMTTAFSESQTSWYEDLAGWSEKYSSWKNIFSKTSNPGKDIYKFVSKKLVLDTDKQAIQAIAQNYGLTDQQAKQAVQGSIAVIQNLPSIVNKHLSTEELIRMQKKLQEDYKMFKDLYDIQQEVDTAISPTEMFSNGDLEDSGFDLLRDLDVIEKILFLDTTEVQSGKPLPGSQGGGTSIIPLPAKKEKPKGGESPVTISEETTDTGEKKKTADIKIGDNNVKADVLDKDVCPTQDPLADALKDYDKERGPSSPQGALATPRAIPSGGEEEGGQPKPKPEEEGVKPALKGNYGGGFCGQAGYVAGEPPFASLGGAPTDSSSEPNMGFSVKVAFCLRIELIKAKATASSSSGCIKCEVDKINAAFNKMYEHTLIPNKTTGNIMESAKCKKAFDISKLLDLKFILVGAPLPAETADDLMFGKNIIAEWNKFVDRYKPIGLGKWDKSATEDFAMTYATEGLTQEELVLSMNAARAKNLADIDTSVKSLAIAGEATDSLLFSQPILDQMREMSGFFDAFKKQLDNINPICSNITSKSCLP